MKPRNPEIMGYWCSWRTIWDRRGEDEYFRTDSTFGAFQNYRFFRLVKGQEIISSHPEGHHCGSAPVMPPENVKWINIRVKHMGYDTHEQRMRKFEFYQENDHFKNARDIGNDDYSHLIDLNVQLEKWIPNNGISVIMMIKNEEEHILGCLENLEPIADEFIIIDTGSEDKTIDIVKCFAKFTAVPVKLIHYPWPEVYSIPRNLAKLHASQRWVMFMDADERFEPEDLIKIFNTSEGEADLALFHVVNYLKKTYPGEKPVYASTESARLFRNIPELYFTGIIHETIDDAYNALSLRRKITIARPKVVLHHYGYIKNQDRLKEKLQNYSIYNERQIEITDGKDPRPYFNLALHYFSDGDKKKTLEYLRKALELNPDFWHGNSQMAAMNLQSAKEFLSRTIETIPPEHPYKLEAQTILRFLEEHSVGPVKVT
jgi:glycosyltransferase involved in cell wall biosynthesis